MLFKRLGWTLLLFGSCLCGVAQPATEIILCDLSYENFLPVIGNPQNISQNPGYDNQPAFLPDGTGVLFASTRDGQTDILQYDILSGDKTWLSQTPGSEYSPQIIPGEKLVSAVRLEQDGTQLLWAYPIGAGIPKILVENVKVGYYTWLGKQKLAAFVLGDPPVLSILRRGKQKQKILTENIGRSLHTFPNSRTICFVDKASSDTGIIRIMNPVNGKNSRLVEALEGSQDLGIMPDGTLLMAQGTKLYKWTRGVNTRWEEIADMASYELGEITRLAVSPTGNKIALVVSESESVPHEQ